MLRNLNKIKTGLIIDDHKVTRKLIRKVLSGFNDHVLEASSGNGALKILQETPVSYIVLDIVMPDMDGFETLRKIRQLPHSDKTPILMLTGLDDIDAINKAYKYGATDFISKPLNTELLKYRVIYMLRTYELLRQLYINEKRLLKTQEVAKMAHFEINLSDNSTVCSPLLGELLGHNYTSTFNSLDNFLAPFPDDVSSKLLNSFSKLTPGDIDQHITIEFMLNKPKLEHHLCMTFIKQEDSFVEEQLIVGTVQDITERKVAEQQVLKLAHYDHLTGVPNRKYFSNYVEQSIKRCKTKNEKFALLYIDIDNFKQINDNYGHDIGDIILSEFWFEISQHIRKKDFLTNYDCLLESENHFISRIGGDEFVLLLFGIQNPDGALSVAKRIIDRFAMPFQIKGTELKVTISIGISIFPDDGENINEILKNADLALYHAKSNGKNNYHLYYREMGERVKERTRLKDLIISGLEDGIIFAHFQPLIDLGKKKPFGCEALLRWPNKTISTIDLINIAEETGLIQDITKYMMHYSFKIVRQKIIPTNPDFILSINISPLVLLHMDFYQELIQASKLTGLPLRNIMLEITENIIIDETYCNKTALNKLKKLGCLIAIDDFGAGYTSLKYLKEFPIDIIKIDQSYIRGIPASDDDASIIRAILMLAKNLGLKVLAEGIESKKQHEFLRAVDCNYSQGFYYGKPSTLEEVIKQIYSFSM